MGNNYLYNLGDSWAWGYGDSFDIPLKPTYADIVAKHFGLEKVTCCNCGWALGNAVELFLQKVYPRMTEGDCVLVTIPPDTRLVVARPNYLDEYERRGTRTVYANDPMWTETVKMSNANPYHFELIINKDLMLIASLCEKKNVKYAFQHNYSTMTFDPRWEMDLINAGYIDKENSMMDWLQIDRNKCSGTTIEDQLKKNLDGVKFEEWDPKHFSDLITDTAHPNIKGHKLIADILTHKLEKLWNMQPMNGIN